MAEPTTASHDRLQACRQAMRRLAAGRRARGKCPRCEDPMDREGYACRACTDLHNLGERDRRAERKAS